MSKMYENYLELKMKSKKVMYLFECGNFYIFLADDAEKISKMFDLKLTPFANNIKKCGFPKNSFVKYMQIFKTKKLKIQVIENNKKEEKNIEKENINIVNTIRNVDLNMISPMEAFELLKKLKNNLE